MMPNSLMQQAFVAGLLQLRITFCESSLAKKTGFRTLSASSNLLCVHCKFMQANWYLCAT